MKIAQLKNIIKDGESENLEFKTSTGSISAAMQTVCAFLNSESGGVVIFGVRDNGELVGQEVADKTKKEIGIELNKIEPSAGSAIVITYLPLENGRKLIVLAVNSGERKPYTYDGRPFIRVQSTTRRMTNEEFTYAFRQAHPTAWEKLTSINYKIEDLDKKLIKDVIKKAVLEKRLPDEALDYGIHETLKNLDLIINDQLTNAAMVLFCKNERKQVAQSIIKLARFRGTTRDQFISIKEYKNNAFVLLEKAMDFLVFVLPLEARIEEGKLERIETPAVPYKVLREALINALIHRDYSNLGGSISISIYDDRVEIENYGYLPANLEVNDLFKKHQSIQRNPLIAHVFYLCKMIEKWGRGTLDMIVECKKIGNPLPIFEEGGGGFSVTFPLREPMPTIIYKEEKKEINLNEKQKEIINILKSGSLTRQQIMSKMEMLITDRVMQKELTKLKNLGLIKLEGKGKATIWLLVD